MAANDWTLGRNIGGEVSTRWDERHLARLGATQDGVVRIDQLTDLGLTRDARQWRTAQRRLVPRYRGVYAIGHGELTERGEFRAAAWACGDIAHLSALASARLMNLWERPVRRIDVIVPPSRRPRITGITIHRASLTSPETTHVRGIPCTSVSRTLVDLAPTPALEAVFERAERRRLIRPDLIEALLHGRPGAANLRKLLATHRPMSKATRSLLERRLLAELRRRGVPEPLVNETLVLDALTLEPDLMWPAQRVLVELDGMDTHGTPTAIRRDKHRDRQAVLGGWLPLRFTWDDVEQDLSTVVAEIVSAIT
jgi:very-short-patch-repair endonuclease